MELSNEFFGSLIGAVVGSALAAFGFIYKKSSDQKEDMRQLIFFLLEMYGFLKVVEVFTPRRYLEACEKVMVRLGYEETKNKEDLYKIMEPLVKPQIEEAMKDLSKWDEDGYIKNLNSVARYNPVVAYRLKANSLLKFIGPQMRKYYERYLESLDRNGLPREEVEKSMPHFESGTLQYIRSELKEDILNLARSVSYLEFIKIKKALRSYESRDPEAAIEPFFRKVLSDMEPHGK